MNAMLKLALLSSLVLLSGCTGTGGSSSYGCKAPDGVACQSVSGVYANSTQNNLPSQRAFDTQKTDKESSKEVPYKDANSPSVIGTTLNSGDPLRTQSRVLRVWIAPWEDSDGDMNDQSYSYLVVDSGRWMIDQSRRNIANEYAPSKPPTGINATNNIRPNPNLNPKNGDYPTGEMP